jgi:2,4-dienoyl-CoA reductase-like NADH-dependent reductase (Old Yellow Enzyme family)
MHQRFKFKESSELLAKANELSLVLPFSEDITPLFKPAYIGERRIENRLLVQPMEGYDSLPDGSPSDLTIRRYHRYAEGGSGMIWFEAIASRNDGRSNPRQLMITEGNRDSYKKLIGEMREMAPGGIDPFIVAQITHSGRYSKPDGNPRPLVPQSNPLLDNGSPRILSDRELSEIRDSLVSSSRLAFEAGFDAVDIKACHGYLVHELLSARNRKDSIYGGEDTALRFRFLLETIGMIRLEVPGLTITLRLNISDLYPGGFGTSSDGVHPDLKEPLQLIGELRKYGISLLNTTMGSPYYNPYVVRPFDTPVPGSTLPDEHPLEGVVRMIEGTALIQHSFPGMLIAASGYSWLRQFAPNVGAAVIGAGDAAFIGFGRNSFAYPSMPSDLIKTGKADPSKVCITCSGCTRLIRNLRPGGCVTRDREIYGEELKKLVKDGK